MMEYIEGILFLTTITKVSTVNIDLVTRQHTTKSRKGAQKAHPTLADAMDYFSGNIRTC